MLLYPLEEDEFGHLAVVSGGEGGGGSCRPREGDRGEAGTVLDGVEVEAADSMVAVHHRDLPAVAVVGVGRGVVVVGEVARLLANRQDESVGAVADGANPPLGRHSYGRPISDWRMLLLHDVPCLPAVVGDGRVGPLCQRERVAVVVAADDDAVVVVEEVDGEEPRLLALALDADGGGVPGHPPVGRGVDHGGVPSQDNVHAALAMGPEAGAAGGEGVHPAGDLWPLLEGDVVPRVAAVVRLDERHAAVDGVAERDAVLPVGPEVHGVVEDALRVVAVRLFPSNSTVRRFEEPCWTRHGHDNTSRLAERVYVPEVDALLVRVEYGRTAHLFPVLSSVQGAHDRAVLPAGPDDGVADGADSAQVDRHPALLHLKVRDGVRCWGRQREDYEEGPCREEHFARLKRPRLLS